MRRFWLLLLLMVLPVQMSWAAIHHCDDATPAGAAVLAVAAQISEQSASARSDDQGPTDSPTKKTPSAHPCHGLHQLMAHPVQAFPGASKETVLTPSEPFFRPSVFASRRDRPQWPAA